MVGNAVASFRHQDGLQVWKKYEYVQYFGQKTEQG
jgi:hypothetical protein